MFCYRCKYKYIFANPRFLQENIFVWGQESRCGRCFGVFALSPILFTMSFPPPSRNPGWLYAWYCVALLPRRCPSSPGMTAHCAAVPSRSLCTAAHTPTVSFRPPSGNPGQPYVRYCVALLPRRCPSPPTPPRVPHQVRDDGVLRRCAIALPLHCRPHSHSVILGLTRNPGWLYAWYCVALLPRRCPSPPTPPRVPHQVRDDGAMRRCTIAPLCTAAFFLLCHSGLRAGILGSLMCGIALHYCLAGVHPRRRLPRPRVGARGDGAVAPFVLFRSSCRDCYGLRLSSGFAYAPIGRRFGNSCKYDCTHLAPIVRLGGRHDGAERTRGRKRALRKIKWHVLCVIPQQSCIFAYCL